MLVLDASIAVKLAVEEPDSQAAHDAVRAERLEAPELILAEVGNVLWRQVRRSVLSRGDGAAALAALPRLFGRLVPLAPLAAQALALATRRQHPIYDCFYVALAAREAATLLTADRRLAETFAEDAAIRLLAIAQPSASA